MKIACVYHPKPYLQNPTAQYGLGLLSLATLAKECGSDVVVLDGQGREWDWVPEVDADVWLLSACLVDVPVLRNMIQQLDGEVIVGGPISHSPEVVPKEATVVEGPGEPFIEKLCSGRNRAEYVDYDRYPIPDRSLMSRYGGNIYHPKSGMTTENSSTLLTSRGCYYACAFCSSGNNDVVMHEYPMERIEEELRQIVDLGITDIRISDDNIMASPVRLAALCKALREAGVKWRGSLRVSKLDKEVYELMARSGCVEVSFGVESGDPEVLRANRKGSTVEQARHSVEKALEAGLHVRMLMMMGTPGERRETLELNKRFVEQFPKAVVSLAIFFPFPGTQIYRHPDKFGVRLRPSDNPNICGFRPDGEDPVANIDIIGGLSRDELTEQYLKMRQFLVEHSQSNRG